MKKKTLIGKKFHSLLLTASISLIIGLVLQISDSLIAGNMLGQDAIGAVNLVLPLYCIILFLSSIITNGTDLLYAEALGNADEKRMSQLYSQGFLLSIGLGVIACVLSLVGRDFYLNFFDVSDTIRGYAKDYYFFYCFVYLFTPLYYYLVGLVFTDGDELICRISYVTTVAGNLGVSILMCRKWGILGIGFGSFIGVFVSTLVVLTHLFKKTNTLRFHKYYNRRELIKVVKYSYAQASIYLYLALLLMFLNSFVLWRFDDRYLSIVYLISLVVQFELFFQGSGNAMMPLLKVYRAEGNTPGIQKLMKYAKKSTLVEGIVFTILIFLAAPLMTRFFGVKDEESLKIAVTGIRIICMTSVFSSFVFLVTSYYLAIEKILFSCFLTLIRFIALPVVLTTVLGIIFGSNGMWVGMALCPVVMLVLTYVITWFKYGKESVMFPKMENSSQVYCFDLELTPSEIASCCNQLAEVMKTQQIEKRVSLKIQLVCEELLQYILNENAGRKVYAECSVIFDADNIKLVLRDNGIYLNALEMENKINTLNAYVLQSVFSFSSGMINLYTIGLNRNLLTFDKH